MKDWMVSLLFLLAICAYVFVGIVITVVLTGEVVWLPAIVWPCLLIAALLVLLVKSAIDLGLYLRMLWF